MDKIVLSKRVRVTEILAKSSAKMVKNCKVGDILTLSVDASPVGGNRGTYATYLRVENITNDEYTHLSFNQLHTLYRAVKVEEE